MELDIFVVDAFTEHQFEGNSAAVIPLDDWLEPALIKCHGKQPFRNCFY